VGFRRSEWQDQTALHYLRKQAALTQASLAYHLPLFQVPGLYKIFDEILVNAADNKQRDSSMNRLDVDIDAATNSISVCNNGKKFPTQVARFTSQQSFLQATEFPL
jgi:DNA gyrase/topoisomerase IV subunit B